MLSKQILEAEIDNKISENKSEEMQLSIHILSGKNLPVSLNSKVHRQLKFSIENQIYETKFYACEGILQTSKWNESYLIPITSIDSCIKIVYIEHETSAKPLGGAVIKLLGFMDQIRHDGWYDIGCGEIRLAIRFIHSPVAFYRSLLNTLGASIQDTEKSIQKISNIENDVLLTKLYQSLVTKNIKNLVFEAKSIRRTMDFAATKIQKSFKNLVKARKHPKNFKKIEKTPIKAESFSKPNNETHLDPIENLIKTEAFSLITNSETDSNVPPYIEAAEKVFKRRIAIKRY